MHDKDRSLIDIEASEAALELIAIGQVEVHAGRVRRFRHRERIDLDFETPPPASFASFAIARIDEQAVKPRLEAIGIPQAVEAPPGRDKRVLRSVLGSRVVAEDQPGDDVEPADRDARQLTERVVIARHRPLNEIPLHPGLQLGAASVVALQTMSLVEPISVPVLRGRRSGALAEVPRIDHGHVGLMDDQAHDMMVGLVTGVAGVTS